MKQNGTMIAHGREWPLWESRQFSVEIEQNRLATVEEAETLRRELTPLLERFGMSATVKSYTVLGLSPEDQAEKNALDEEASAWYFDRLRNAA